MKATTPRERALLRTLDAYAHPLTAHTISAITAISVRNVEVILQAMATSGEVSTVLVGNDSDVGYSIGDSGRFRLRMVS